MGQGISVVGPPGGLVVPQRQPPPCMKYRCENIITDAIVDTIVET